MEIELVGARELVARLERDSAQIRQAVTQAMRAEMTRLRGDVQADLRAGSPLTYRSGALSNSIFDRVDVEADAIVGRVGTATNKAVYGRIHELGGEITPKRGKYLAIPLGPAKTDQVGRARFSARELMDNPEAFGYRRAFVYRARGVGQGLTILGVRGERSIKGAAKGSVVPLFALVRRVKLPARAFLGTAFTRAKDRIVAALNAAVDRALAGKGDGGPA